MRIAILGAGPAGLYAALLLKQANPDHAVRVVERNPAGATYGFGVVLSDRTLTSFREADRPSFDAIAAHQASWNAIETYVLGERVRCEGHEYLGIGRKRLLDVLCQRCEELGVELSFSQEVRSLDQFTGADLIIAADGVNSLARAGHAFGTTVTPGRSRYIWLGTAWTPSAFTFVFHATEHGLFQAHMYPYDKGASTCVLMCGEETWRRAGLDHAREAESLEFARRLLAPYTQDAAFLGNRSVWSSFQTVRNRCWSHGNLVLLGDAAHTAHWSIGSGTKLAMEDAIALVRSLSASADLPAALARYEAERRPAVERLQQAGQVSERYCEEIERAVGLPPVQFAFQLMTRSGRIDYDSLRQRDPGFVAAVEAVVAHAAGVANPTEPLQCPLRLRGLTLPNRLVAEQPGSGAGLVLVDDPAADVDALRATGARVGLRLSGPPDVRHERFDLVVVTLGPGSELKAVDWSLADLVLWEGDEPERVRAASGLPVAVRVASRAAGNTLVAGARADLCLVGGAP